MDKYRAYALLVQKDAFFELIFFLAIHNPSVDVKLFKKKKKIRQQPYEILMQFFD